MFYSCENMRDERDPCRISDKRKLLGSDPERRLLPSGYRIPVPIHRELFEKADELKLMIGGVEKGAKPPWQFRPHSSVGA